MEEACGKERQFKPYCPSQLEDLVSYYTSTAENLAYLWLLVSKSQMGGRAFSYQVISYGTSSQYSNSPFG